MHLWVALYDQRHNHSVAVGYGFTSGYECEMEPCMLLNKYGDGHCDTR